MLPLRTCGPLRIHLVLEVTVPEGTPLFQALMSAFWRVQGLAPTTLFTAVLQAIEARARAELAAAHGGRSGTRAASCGSGSWPSGACGCP